MKLAFGGALDVMFGIVTPSHRALKWAVFLGAAGIAVYLSLAILRPFLSVIAWSAVLALTSHPVHQHLVRKTGRVALSAFLTSVLVVLAVLVPLLFMAAVALDQLLSLGQSVGQTFQRQDAITQAAQVVGSVTARLGVDAEAIELWIRQHASELAQAAGQYTLSVAASATGAIVSFIFIIFALFLLLRDGEQLVARIPDYLPFDRARSEALLHRIAEVVHGGVRGVVMIALVQGALCGAMFWALGIPSAALWGMVTVLTSVLPVVGAGAVWVPGTVYLALTGQWPKVIVLAVWGTFVVSGIDNFLRPRLVAGRVGLSELVMFFALLGGLQAFGLLGIVLGPVVFATVAAIVEVLAGPSPSVVGGDAA